MKRIFTITLFCVISMNAFASDITLDLNVIGNDQKLVLSVKTNLPPHTILMATLINPINQGGDGYAGQAKSTVSVNQVVQFGPFSKTGDRLSPGIYQVMVTTVMAALQPEEVQPIFGVHGEKLTGGRVSTLPGTSERVVSQTFRFKINQDGSISGPPPDEQTIGSAGDVWRKVQSDARSDAGRSYGYSNRKFVHMGLCMACADNVAQWYVQRPTSRCGMLAKHGLEGDSDAVKELQTFPSYCTWDYK